MVSRAHNICKPGLDIIDCKSSFGHELTFFLLSISMYVRFNLNKQFHVFRLRDKVVTTMTETAKRYVITNPSFDFGLLPTDQVSVFYLLHPEFKDKYESVQLQNINHYFISTEKLSYIAIDTLILLVWHLNFTISVKEGLISVSRKHQKFLLF